MPAKKTTKKQGSATAEEQAPRALIMTLGDRSLPVVPLVSLTLQERFAIRQITGSRAEDFYPQDLARNIGDDTLAVWWWIARRRADSAALPFAVVEADLAAEGRIAIALEEAPGGDDPEG